MANRLPKEKESKVQRSIIVRLRRLGIVLFRRNVGALREGDRFIRFASPGQSDLWGIYRNKDGHGIHVEIEVKRPGNRPTELQLAWLRRMSDMGAIAFWSDSTNIAERVAEAVINGGRIVWHENGDFDVEMPDGL